MTYSQLNFSNREKMTSSVKGFPRFMPQFTQQDKYDCQKKSKKQFKLRNDTSSNPYPLSKGHCRESA